MEIPVLQGGLCAERLGEAGMRLRSGDETCVLRGALYELVIPLIDGRRSCDDIVEELSGRAEPEMVYYALRRLQQRGLILEAGRAGRPVSPAAWEPQSRPKSARIAEETVERLSRFMAPDGWIPRPEPIRREGPICISAASVSGFPRRIATAVGKGRTPAQAEAARLGESVERYCATFHGDEPRVRARWADLGPPAVHPGELLGFSAAQYERREAWNRDALPFNRVPERYDESQEIEWVAAWSLSRRAVRYLPAAYCYYSYPLPEQHRFCEADSNGCAAGNTWEEAVLAGFLELVERDSTALWWYNRVRRPGVDLATFGDPLFDAVESRLERLGRALEVLDATSDMGIPAFAALSWMRDGSGILFGFGAHLDACEAVSRALVELEQVRTFADESEAMRRWLKRETLAGHPYLAPADARRTAASYPKLDHGDVLEDIRVCIDRAGRAGLEVLALNLTRPEIGFPVARVVVPGLRHFAARFAPGRLFDVPVRLGWLKEPRAEPDLNPVPLFL